MTNLSQALCSIQNAQQAHRRSLSVPFSKLVWSLLKILLVHGYIKGFFRQKGSINIFLKQNEEGKGLRKIQQISRSKQRVYVSCKKFKFFYVCNIYL